VPATTDPTSIGPVDLVVFFTKCYHTAAAAESARPLVGPDTVVASLQNGWGNGDVLAGVYPEEQIVVGVTYNSGLVQAPARVVHPADQPTIVGSFADGQADDARPARLAEALSDGGLEVSVASPVRPEIWKKLILNAATLPTAALTGMHAGALTAHAPMHDLVSETAREAVAVARASATTSRRRSASTRSTRARGGLSRLRCCRLRGGSEDGDRRDQRRRRPRSGRARSDVPLNRAFVQLVKGWESLRGLD
jgi:2-dehydropantoate 2-reductase